MFTAITYFILVKSFTEVGPLLLQKGGVNYLLREIFSQDPLERYFSRQRHRGGSCDNPHVNQVLHNALSLLQQKETYRDLQTMNIEMEDESVLSQPLPKRRKVQSLAHEL